MGGSGGTWRERAGATGYGKKKKEGKRKREGNRLVSPTEMAHSPFLLLSAPPLLSVGFGLGSSDEVSANPAENGLLEGGWEIFVSPVENKVSRGASWRTSGDALSHHLPLTWKIPYDECFAP